MRESPKESNLAAINNALIYYETAGEGQPFVMIHAGVADHRQWNNEFALFAKNYHVIRYDMRGYGKSEPVEGEFSHLQDLISLLDFLQIDQPLILMGCSMGGGLAIDFALEQPDRVKALIMVGSAPSGVGSVLQSVVEKLDVPFHPKAAEAEQADKDGDLDRLAELEIQIFFDGMHRTPQQVNQAMRQLAYEMNRNNIEFESRATGKLLPNTQTLAVERLEQITIPVLVIVGDNDVPFIPVAAQYMEEKMLNVKKVMIEDAAHLTNMDQPAVFQQVVADFLAGVNRVGI
jgi:3-oxoadipate enol-lactonase